MSCYPCTKLCPMCSRIILISSWAAHAHGCRSKEKREKQKEQDMDDMVKNCFKPWISERARTADSTFTQAKNRGKELLEKVKKGETMKLRQARFPLRDQRVKDNKKEAHEKRHEHLTFKPEINERSKHLHRMVHENSQDGGQRLATARPAHRVPEKERKPQPEPANKEPEFVPQITVRAVQKGLERAGCSIFHRLHHGPPEKALFVDPGTEISEDATVHHQTKHVMRCKKPHGLNSKSWDKVKHEQQCNYEDMINRRKGLDVDSPSPASTGFPEDGGIPSSPDLYTPQQYSARSMGTTPGGRSFGTTPGGVGSMQARPASAKATPSEASVPARPASAGGGVRALSGKIRASLQSGDAAGLALSLQEVPLGSPVESDQESNVGETQLQPHVLVGTPKVMGLLTRCHRAVQVTAPEGAKREPLEDW